MAWTSVSRVGAVGCTDFAGAICYELCWLSLFLPPSLPLSWLCSICFFCFSLHSLPALLPLLLCFFRRFLYLSSLPSLRPPPLPPCSMRLQVGSATLGCRAALTASSATACLRVQGSGTSLRTWMKPCIIWTGCSRVSLRHTSMNALDVFARCDA